MIHLFSFRDTPSDQGISRLMRVQHWDDHDAIIHQLAFSRLPIFKNLTI